MSNTGRTGLNDHLVVLFCYRLASAEQFASSLDGTFQLISNREGEISGERLTMWIRPDQSNGYPAGLEGKCNVYHIQ